MKKTRKWMAIICIIALASTFLTFNSRTSTVYAAKSSEQLRKEQEEEKKKLAELEKQKKELEESLGDMKNDLTDISSQVASLQSAIGELEEEITIKEVELEEAEETSAKQYEQMKKRIQFMYENSLGTEAAYLFGAETISEFLNKTEYISSITEYDRNLLDKYIETQNLIASTKAQLEKDRDDLLASKKELESKEETLLASIDKQKDKIDSTSSSIDNQEDKLKDLDKELQKMIAYEKSLKESQDYSRPEIVGLVGISLKEREASMPTWGNIVTPREGEEELLAAIIYCEAGIEPYDGKVAVGTVVLNRVNSQFFPNTITDVIYERNQFSPVASGRLSVVLSRGLTTDSCRKAAREVLAGNFTGTWLYFCTVRPTVVGDVIGTQVFY